MTQESDAKPTSSIARRSFLKMTALGGMLGLSGMTNAANNNFTRRSMFVIDALGDITNENLSEADQNGPNQGVDKRAISDAKKSGLVAFNHTLGYVFGDQDPFEFTLKDIATWDHLIRHHEQDLYKVYRTEDILEGHKTGKIGVIYGFQNAAMMGNDATRVALFAKLGVRVVQLTYNGRNQLGDGSMDPENRGLTEFGHQVVEQLNQNHVMVDLSHSGEQICLDAIQASRDPIIISHTGCRAVTDLPRNKTDRELRGVAERGGFVGIYFMPFLAKDRQPMAADLIAHIEHAIQVCGEDHVGIGTDGSVPKIDDMATYMENLRKEVAERRAKGIGAAGERADIVKFLPDLVGPDKFHRLAELLHKRGHSSARIDKIMGKNFLRTSKEIWT